MIKTLARALAAALRPSPKTSLIALLSLFSLAGFEARADSPDQSLSAKEVKRGARIVAKLRRMEHSRVGSSDFEKPRKPFEKPLGSLFVEIAELPASDLKTDLATAIFLYQEAHQGWLEMTGDNAKISCEDELSEVYARICRENQTGTLADFLKAKARLHVSWAEALINEYRGSKDAATIAALKEMKGERRNDVRLAGRALLALKSLEKEIYGYSTLAEFEEHRRLARVPFEQLAREVSKALQSVDRVLLSLPRSPLFYPLYHARNAYADGLFWWQKTHCQSQLVVNVNSFNEPDEMKPSNFEVTAVHYTVVINWRKAIKHAREAENIIKALKID